MTIRLLFCSFVSWHNSKKLKKKETVDKKLDVNDHSFSLKYQYFNLLQTAMLTNDNSETNGTKLFPIRWIKTILFDVTLVRGSLVGKLKLLSSIN